MGYKILVINPGSTSDDFGYFEGDSAVVSKTIRYSPLELKPFEHQKVTAQYDFRKKVVLSTMKENGISAAKLDAVIGRGGLVKPIPSGTYKITDTLLKDLRDGVLGDHPSNLGGLIANEIGLEAKIPSFIADPVVVDEMEPLARYSGMPENPRISIVHALNQKRVARLAADKLGRKYEDCNLIVMHAGGGISVGAHRKGRIVDVNNALDGDGPFTPQRSGGVPAGGLVRMCFSGKYTLADMKLKIKGGGGMIAYTGTSDMQALGDYILRDIVKPGTGLDTAKVSKQKALECLKAMAYQMSKEICSMAAVLEGKVDAIVLTGGLAYDSEILMPEVKARVGWLAQIMLFPGGDEKRALRDAAARALDNPGTVLEYK